MDDPIIKGLVYMIVMLFAIDYYLWVNGPLFSLGVY